MSMETQTAAETIALQEYDVTITETLQKTVRVAANDNHDAEQIVSDKWRTGEYVLTADDFTGVEFNASPANRELAQDVEQHREGGDFDMNGNEANTTENSTDTTTLSKNPYVEELFNILEENGKDTSGLSALLGYVGEMEGFVKRAEDTIVDMKAQLDSIKEIQNHPIKSTLQNAVRTGEQRVSRIKERLSELKSSIVKGCKNAIAKFKEGGIAALGNLASFFNVRHGLEGWKKDIDSAVQADNKAIAKIGAFSAEYHSVGLHLKNLARVAVGKEPKTDRKEAGKLAFAISAPYRAQKSVLTKLRKPIAQAITSLEQLETKQEKRKAERKEGQADKPSVLKNLAAKKERVERDKRETPVQERTKAQVLEV